MARDMAKCEISHNDIGEIERGEWRKYNPYNPYVEEKDEKQVADLNIESLDDLFEEVKKDNNDLATVSDNMMSLDDILNPMEENDAPMLPQDDEDTYDLQKELEAKFDEVFGPLDED